MFKKLLLVIAILMAFTVAFYAETLSESLEALSGSAAKAYAHPMITSFGSDMNGGWFHKAPADSVMKWDLEFGIVSMGTLFSSDDEFFNVDGQFRFTRSQAEAIAAGHEGQGYYEDLVTFIMSRDYDVSIYGPTIIGPAYDETDPTTEVVAEFPTQEATILYQGNPLTLTLTGREVRTGVGGLLTDLPLLPLAAPQLSIGTIYGTKLSFRYLPETELTPEIGKLSYMGYGIQHNPAVWLPMEIPVDVALAFFTQNMKIGEIVTASATTTGINVSRTFGVKLLSVTPYAGIAYEHSSMTFDYTYMVISDEPDAPENIRIKFDAEGKNTSRLTAGLNFRLGLINLNFDGNLAKYPSASAGVGLNFSW